MCTQILTPFQLTLDATDSDVAYIEYQLTIDFCIEWKRKMHDCIVVWLLLYKNAISNLSYKNDLDGSLNNTSAWPKIRR